jgi:hypothetical protein
MPSTEKTSGCSAYFLCLGQNGTIIEQFLSDSLKAVITKVLELALP